MIINVLRVIFLVCIPAIHAEPKAEFERLLLQKGFVWVDDLGGYEKLDCSIVSTLRMLRLSNSDLVRPNGESAVFEERVAFRENYTVFITVPVTLIEKYKGYDPFVDPEAKLPMEIRVGEARGKELGR